jgi:hypothetical protein
MTYPFGERWEAADGATTTDRLAAPPVDPTKLSDGYACKGPGQADASDPQQWEVASYQFSPASIRSSRGTPR